MTLKKVLLSSLLCLGALSASAQAKAQTEEVFTPHWYVQVQPLGMQHTLGEVSFKNLIYYNAQVAGGYRFTPVVGARLAINGWTSKAGLDINQAAVDYYGIGSNKWTWNYVAPTVDLTVDLSNLLLGYKYDRLFNLGCFVGIGANIAWNNDGILDLRRTIINKVGMEHQNLELAWEGTTVRPVVQFGLTGDFRINDQFSVGLELGANTLPDGYNSKRAGNTDWYFNGLVGVKYAFGETHSTRVIPAGPQPIHRVDTIYIKEPVQVIERVVEQSSATAAAAQVVEPLRRDIFFTIRATQVVGDELRKVEDIANYLNENPDANVVITGYADKGTGNVEINTRLSQKRADAVATLLRTKYGIAASRISTAAKGHFEQPYAENDKNRVSICIAE